MLLARVALAIVSVVAAKEKMYTSFYWNLAAGATIVLFETLMFRRGIAAVAEIRLVRAQA